MRFTVDPWDPAYGASLDADPQTSTAEVDVGVEFPAGRWHPVDPPAGVAAPDTVRFVDGVRRVDARAWVAEPDGTASPALCGSYAAGVVCCRPGRAELADARVWRRLFTVTGSGADIATPAGQYRVTVPGAPPGDLPPMRHLSLALQGSMAAAEQLAAVEAAELTGPADLLVVDGRLPARPLPRAIGYIKSHHGGYLPATLHAVVTALGPGQRTPVFRLGRPRGGSWERCSWYLRLPSPDRGPWAGVVRVECAAELAPDAAVGLAGLSQVTLPRFASAAHKDPRAPQNLYPIAGLERALRRRLGDPALLYRALRRAAAA